MANEVEIVVTGHNRLGNLFGQIRQGIASALRRAQTDADREGKSVGRRIASSIGDALKKGNRFITDAMNSVMTGSLKGALSTPIIGPIILLALAGAITAIAPALAAAIGGAMTLAFGGAFVGLGAMLLLQNEKIKASFTKTFDEIKGILTDAFKPLIPVLDVVRGVMKGLAKDFAPVIRQFAEMTKGPLIGFVKNLGQAFSNLKPAFRPMAQAFNDLLNTIGPQLPGLFSRIADAIANIAQVVSENKTVIAALFLAMLEAIPLVLNAIGGLISFFGELVSAAVGFGAGVARVMADAASAVLGFVADMLGALREVGVFLSNVPGLEEFGQNMVRGLDGAIAKVNEWDQAAQNMAKQVELRADTVQLTQAIDKARAQLNDPNLTKERRAKINAEIRDLEIKKAAAIRALNDPKLTKEYEAQLRANISNLQSRLAQARKELKDPNLTKTRKADLKAEIGQLKANVSIAKSAIASVRGKTVHIRTINETWYRTYYDQRQRLFNGRAHGGIIGAQGGGPRSAMTLVGEAGPEIVELPFGSRVIPAGETRNRMAQGDMSPGGGGSVTVEFDFAGATTPLERAVVEVLRKAVRNKGGNVQVVLGS